MRLNHPHRLHCRRFRRLGKRMTGTPDEETDPPDIYAPGVSLVIFLAAMFSGGLLQNTIHDGWLTGTLAGVLGLALGVSAKADSNTPVEETNIAAVVAILTTLFCLLGGTLAWIAQ